MRTYLQSDDELFIPHHWPPHVMWSHTIAFHPTALVATSLLVTIDVIVVVFVGVGGGGGVAVVGVGVFDACYCTIGVAILGGGFRKKKRS